MGLTSMLPPTSQVVGGQAAPQNNQDLLKSRYKVRLLLAEFLIGLFLDFFFFFTMMESFQG